jgi:hypothetical protein
MLLFVMAKSRCVKTQFTKTILCAGTMQDYLIILSRTITGTEPGVSIQPTETFTPLDDPAGYLEGVKPVQRWNGVSVEDQSASNFTHVAYIPYDPVIYKSDVGTLYVKKPGDTADLDRLFKLKGINNWGEQDEYLQLTLAETGFDEKEGAHG